jgi:hypothetical protein
MEFLNNIKKYFENAGILKAVLIIIGGIGALAIIVFGLVPMLLGLFMSGQVRDTVSTSNYTNDRMAAESSAPAPMMAKAGGMNYSDSVSISNYQAVGGSYGNVSADSRMMIKTGSLELVVKDTEDAVMKITQAATNLSGFVDSSNLYANADGSKSGTVTVRIPSKSFDDAMSRLKSVAVKVERESLNGVDVTAQFVDTEGRLKNMKAEEAQYQDIMKRAVKVQDVLDVASRLADVRGRIEQTQGQLNYLSRQIDYSVITVGLTAEKQIEVVGGILWRPWTVVKQSARDLLNGLAGFADSLITFVFYIPLLILKIAIVVLIIWIVIKVLVWLKRKMFKGGKK